jgi:hypothetical protein
MTASLIAGSALASVIVFTAAPGMLKLIVSRPGKAALLASRIACRNEPAPASLILVTRNVAGAIAVPAARFAAREMCAIFS